MPQIAIDTRWDGIAGIQRYSREVLPRLKTPWVPLGLDGDHLAPADALRPVPTDRLIYSPGYNAFVRAPRELLTMHDLIQLQTPWPGRAKYLAYYRLIVRPVVRRTGAVLTVSETSKALVEEWLGDASVRVVNAGIGCSDAFRADGSPALASDPYLMYVGNLRAHKNVAVVLDALARVPGARLRMLLPAREHDEAQRMAAARGIGPRVELLAGIDDDELARQYRGAAATVMPSTLEGFGLPALESVMTGTPVLFWRGCAAVAETVGDRGTALESATDVEEWAAAIRSALESPRRVEAPVAGYDWDATAARIDEVLASLGR
ncbi:glycosyltransferase family 1 protein [Microbacterium oryzae]|uniref:glycosyltransferase family 4 protein n=1 Tax=Microbacterium oryzae TaxID=743009 RepID=UPI0025B1F58E|nr:glycosyltransferase family 1 protein [Microbacterium oryzae]MDN3310468.1 glycosyltransferase family 1 protein [Microbacterium oryzae]